MSNVKGKITLSLVVILVFMAFSSVFAADVNYIMNISSSYKGKALAYEEEIVLKNSDTNRTLKIDTDAKYVDSSLTIYYTMGVGTRKVVSTGVKSTTLTMDIESLKSA